MKTLADISDEIESGPHRRRFIVKDLLPVGISVLYAPTGVGKTGVAIQLAVSVSSGSEFGGHEVMHGAALYIALEDSGGVEERMMAAAVVAGLDPRSLPIGIVCDFPAGLTSCTAKDFLLKQAHLLQEKTGRPVVLVIIDTYGTALIGESQDDAKPATLAADTLYKLATILCGSVLVLHHTGKDGRDIRGSQVICDRADSVIKASKSKTGRRITVEKMRNARAGTQFSFEIGSHLLETAEGKIDVQVVHSIEAIDAVSDQQNDTEMARQVVAKKDVDLIFGAMEGLPLPVTFEAWRNASFQAMGDRSDQAKRTAFFKAKEKLITDGKIEIKGKIVTVSVTRKTLTKPVTLDPTVSVTVTAPLLRGGGVVTTNDIPEPMILDGVFHRRGSANV